MRALALVGIAACAGAPPTRPPEPEVAPDAEVTRVPVPLILPGADAAPAVWLEELHHESDYDPVSGNVRALGPTAALIDTSLAAWFAASTAHGAQGPLLLPEDTKWVGLGGEHDQVFAATTDGTLYRADDVATASATGFTKITRIEGASRWAAAEGIVAAAAGDEVHVSKNGGVKFRAARVASGFVATELFARMDGVLVADGELPEGRVTFVSSGGKKWKRSSLQAAQYEQRGSWIEAVCANAVLAWGSTDWVVPEWSAAALVPLEDMLRHDHDATIHTPRAWETAVSQRPPVFSKDRQVKGVDDSSCARDPSGVGHSGFRRAVPDRRPLTYLAGRPGAAPPISRTLLELTDDGECPGPPDGDCEGPVTRAPHAILIDRGPHTARILAAPAGCVPRDSFSARGLAFVGCDDGGGTVLQVLADGAWQSEGAIPTPVTSLDTINLAADGTAALFAGCSADGVCPAWVRAPEPPGRGAWREVVIAGARVLRVLPRGAVVGLVEDTVDGTRVSVVLTEPGADPRTLVRGVPLHARVKTVEVVDGTLQLSFEDQTSGIVADDGTLIPGG